MALYADASVLKAASWDWRAPEMTTPSAPKALVRQSSCSFFSSEERQPTWGKKPTGANRLPQVGGGGGGGITHDELGINQRTVRVLGQEILPSGQIVRETRA